jgi:hypothetical protein
LTRPQTPFGNARWLVEEEKACGVPKLESGDEGKIADDMPFPGDDMP